jgi:hypothetical protein
MRSLSETIASAGQWSRERVWNVQATRGLFLLAARSAREQRASPRWLLRRLAHLRREGYLVHPYLAGEAKKLGLLDPTAPPEQFRDSASPMRFRPLQLRLSPPPLWPVIDDKALFYTVCNLAGLPVPETYAFVYRNAPGWTCDGRTPQTRAEWIPALARLLEGEVIAKPSTGDMGEGVRAFRREGDSFFEGSKPIGDAGRLYDALFVEKRFDGFVLQRRLQNHPALAGLSETRTLQATRIVTLVDRDDVSILFATQKLVGGDAVVDNVHNGQYGNGSAGIDVETGRLRRLAMPLPGGGLAKLAEHPRTGRTCLGFQLPWWPETLELVTHAAVAFSMSRTIGWDVAITEDGPVLLEANSGWAPANGPVATVPALRRLEEAVRREEEQAHRSVAELDEILARRVEASKQGTTRSSADR